MAYVTSECKFQGECSGTCPKCEAELRYLEEELNKRRQAGKAVAVAGIAAALVVGSAACTPISNDVGGAPPAERTTNTSQELFGYIPAEQEITAATEPTTLADLMSEPALSDPTEPSEWELMGDMILPD